MDLHELIIRRLNWDDILPDNLRSIWKSHLEIMQKIKHIKYKRTIIPDDAKSLDITTSHHNITSQQNTFYLPTYLLTTINFGDASKSIACAVIYGRILRQNNKYSYQLLSQPRAQLFAAVLNAHTGEVVRRSL